MSDGKKNSLNKKITIKNKKEAEKVLNKKKNNSTKAKKPSTIPKTKTTKKVIAEKTKVTESKTTKKIDIKKTVTKKKKKTEEKAKLVIPKEWQNISTNKKQKNKQIETPDNLSGKLKNTIFEEVTEQEIREKKLKKQKNNKKHRLKIIITVLMILAILIIFIKYNEILQKSLTVYDEYEIGEKVTLKDNSIWYVIEYSDNSTPTIKLIKETQIDINNDGKYDNNDKMKYNTSNIAVYDITDKNSVAYYLENEYKSKLTEKIGSIENIGILTSNEFIKARKKMGYGYEWTEGNWLANSTLDNWWITSVEDAKIYSTENKIYAVTKNGTYKLCNANTTNYIRPVITITKDMIEKKD